MMPWVGILSVLAIATLSTALAARFDHRPGAKRVHLFETDGERENPFRTNTADEAGAAATCRRCGNRLEAVPYRYCESCPTPEPTD